MTIPDSIANDQFFMTTITRKQIRIACIVLALLYVAAAVSLWAEPHGYLGRTVQRASMWRHQGLFVPVWVLYLTAFTHFAVFFSGLAGTFMFKKWGRNLLTLAVLIAMLFLPLQGEIVFGPLSAILNGSLSLIHIWLVSILIWSPIRLEFEPAIPDGIQQ